MNKSFLKIAVIFFFVGLLITYVAYQSGVWEKDEAIIVEDSSKKDSIKVDDLKKLEILPSSKAIIIKEDLLETKDTNDIKDDVIDSIMLRTIMSSSKFRRVLDVDDIKKK